MSEAQYLDEQTIIEKLPNITPEEAETVLKRRAAEELRRVSVTPMGV